MSGLHRMNQRLFYRGGDAESRLRKDKLESLRKSLLYSYQSETIILDDKREFRCLINPNKNTDDIDDKIISIPFRDICLNREFRGEKTHDGKEEIGLNEGDIFTWKQNKTKWLVYLRYFEEDAYFRAKIRRCTNVLEVGGYRTWIAMYNHSSTALENKTSVKVHSAWNNPNREITIIVPKNKKTSELLHRFKKVYIYQENSDVRQPWKVQNINESFGDGCIEVFLKEDYNNFLEPKEELEVPVSKIIKNEQPFIDGLKTVVPFSKNIYSLKNIENGNWYVRYGDKEVLIAENSNSVELFVEKTEDKFFDVIVKSDELEEDLIFTVTIDTF